MRVFMLGWEFPPFISGGLGTACHGLTRAMSGIGVDIIFVLPRPIAAPFSTHVRLVSARPGSPLALPDSDKRVDEFDRVTFRSVKTQLTDPYQKAADFQREPERGARDNAPAGGVPSDAAESPAGAPAPGSATQAGAAPMPSADHYGGDLFAEVRRYAQLAVEIARQEQFDVVHAHDWMTFPAGMAVAAATGVPLVVHVHSTEFDRSGVYIDRRIYEIERRGMHAAMKVIAVSYLTKNQVTSHYGIAPAKVEVVYNAIEFNGGSVDPQAGRIRRDEKIVLFLGRITHQKGPEYFLAAAKKVLEYMDNVKFVMAGSGDLTRRTIDLAAHMGIGHKMIFTGFLRGADVETMFKMADLYVMPSVSEPFGIAPLEAMSHDVPVIISRQSGVSEVLRHVLKVDFWDTNEMANKIIAVLRHPPLASTLRQHGGFEVSQLSWTDAARSCVRVYEEARGMMTAKI
jgi:glycosyltransferase involved in cell wall biosynthesis